MEITGLGWSGTRTDRSRERAYFYEHVHGLRLVHTETGSWVFELPDGRHAEVFGRDHPGKEHFTTGPVAGSLCLGEIAHAPAAADPGIP
jgi:hypothetical protein